MVAGAGLGGLTAAIALARLGHRVRVFEQAAALGEVGAGITLSSGTMRCFELLGLEAAVVAISQESVNLPFLHYRSGAVLRAGLSVSGTQRPSTARNARQVHRADLHALLASELRRIDAQAIELGCKVAGLDQSGNDVLVRFADGRTARGDVLVGADGGRSRIRDALFGPTPLQFSGQVAFRCLVPMELARPHLVRETGAVYLGPGATLNRYPLRGGAVMNCVGIARTAAWQEEGWNTPATNAEYLAQFADWHPEVTGLIGAAPPQGIIKWALFERDPLPRWSDGRVTLLGDAAHPMLPFLGLGAAMAIEDAALMARAFGHYAEPLDALSGYERLRRPRATLIFEASRQQGRLSQAMDPERYATTHAPAHDPSFFDYDPATLEF
jgi:salicylate hydroxylase